MNRESDREKLDREHNERNEREKLEANRMQQNGHRSGAPVVDAELLERVKQRKEEEEKRANERRLAAAKKLQELEQKINKKKELTGENESDSNVQSSVPGYLASSKGDGGNEPRVNDRYRSDDGKIRENTKDSREYGNRYGESKFDRDIGDRSRDRGAPNAGDPFFNKPYQSNLPPRFQKQRDQQDRHPYKDQPPHRSGPREQIGRRPNQSMQQPPPPHIMKRNVDDIRDSKYYNKGNAASGAYSTHSKTSSSGVCESEDDDRVSSGRESISRSLVGERSTHLLGRSTSDSSQIEIKERIGSWADEMESDLKQPLTQRQISSTSSTSANDDIQPKQILQRVRKVSIDSRSDKEKSEERELSLLNISSKSLDQSQDDIIKQFVTSPSMIDAPKSWGDSVPTTPEIARKSIDILSDSSSVTAKITDEKKLLESVLENEASGNSAEKKSDEKPIAKIGRGYTSSHSKDTYSSDDGKHGNVLKRPNARGGRHDVRGGPNRNFGGNSSYRGNNNSNWNNNRRGRSNRYNDYSESEGSDDEFHGRGNRGGKDDRFKHDSSNRRDGQQSHQKDVSFVPRGEPSRRGRGGRAAGPIVKRIDNYGPPNAKSPFGTSDDKADLKPETITEEIVSKKIESLDENILLVTEGKLFIFDKISYFNLQFF